MRSVFLFREGEPVGEYAVAGARRHQQRWLLRFAGVEDLTTVEKLSGCEVRIPAAERPALEDGAIYYSDLIGALAVAHGTGLELGRIVDWLDCGGPPVFVIQQGSRQFEVPFAKSIFRAIDVAGARVELELPEGLLDL